MNTEYFISTVNKKLPRSVDSQNDYCDEALKLFSQMLHGGMKLDECSFVCVLSACGGLAARD